MSADDPYYVDRLENPYRSTVARQKFLARSTFFSSLNPGELIVDIACGTGSETAYLASAHPTLEFLGVDLESKFIKAANYRYQDVRNVHFEVADLYQLDQLPAWGEAKAVLLSQTLSWLKWWRDELSCIIGPNVDRVGLSTLAWDGPAESEVIHYFGNRGDQGVEQCNYNVYSIPALCEQMRLQGFPEQSVEKFAIDIDLEAPNHGGLGSYTVRAESGERLTFSMWQYLPWHFFHFARGS